MPSCNKKKGTEISISSNIQHNNGEFESRTNRRTNSTSREKQRNHRRIKEKNGRVETKKHRRKPTSKQVGKIAGEEQEKVMTLQRALDKQTGDEETKPTAPL